MGDHSKIEWTDASWNPVVGCAKVSEGCRNCYAMKVAHRLAGMGQERYKGLTMRRSSGVEWNGKVRTVPEALEIPLRWKRPRRIFVNSMSDLFHPDVPFDFIREVFWTMGTAKQHYFQVLTKRPERMLEWFTWLDLHFKGFGPSLVERRKWVAHGDTMPWPLPNVWLGVSVEDQKAAVVRIPLLLQTPAAVRWLSIEPLLGPVDIEVYLGDLPEDADGPAQSGIDWVVVGGESGSKARPMHPDWVRSLRDQCTAAGVPFFFKQWGEWAPGECVDKSVTKTETAAWWGEYEPFFRNRWDYKRITPKESEEMHRDDQPDLWKVGKKAAGRILDGRTWDEMPEVNP